MQNNQIVIIGGGPAGITAAIQLQRYNIPFVLLEQERVGGLLWNANLVENYPGFPKGICGPKLIGLIEKQLERLGVQITYDTVTTVGYKKDRFQVETHKTSYNPVYLVVASGTRPKPIPAFISVEARTRVFSEVYPLLDKQDQQIVIIGAGDAAFDYALNLTKNRNSVTILNRGRDVQCLELLWERALADRTITYRAEAPVSKVELDLTANRLTVRLEAGDYLEADYLLSAIGRLPQTGFISASVWEHKADLKAKGRLYFAGDVQNGLLRQTAISAGDGLRAAMLVYQSLKEGSL